MGVRQRSRKERRREREREREEREERGGGGEAITRSNHPKKLFGQTSTGDTYSHLADKSQSRQTNSLEDGLIVYPANAIDSRLQSDWVSLVSVVQKHSRKKQLLTSAAFLSSSE